MSTRPPTTTTPQFRGHKLSSAFREMVARMFGDAKTPPAHPAERPGLIASAAALLEAERRERFPALPAPDTANLIRDERRPITPNEKLHPVHDPSWYRPDERRLWIPWALDAPSGARRGTYAGKYPRGLVIHWTAGHRNGLDAGNEFMRASGMLYLLVDKEGRMAQSDPLSQWGYHAGASSWPTASGTVSDEFAGVEFQAWGQVTRTGSGFRSWSGHAVPAAEVRHSAARGNIRAGHYHILTRAQMHTLRRLCVWLHLNHPRAFDPANIVGHDEVAPLRKADPGGALWDHDADRALTMDELRALVREDIVVMQRK